MIVTQEIIDLIRQNQNLYKNELTQIIERMDSKDVAQLIIDTVNTLDEQSEADFAQLGY